ncbi:MAG TPA: EamA family transporter [Tichowtungia sp.]|nr:EamA family transporter [Tichowtungia sp.]
MIPPYFALALIAAVSYSLGGLFNKQAMSGGCGSVRITAFMIWASALLLLPFCLLYSDPLPLHVWYQPLAASLCFTAGTGLFILALRAGDLSVVAPVSGVKPILNALLVAALLGVSVPLSTWIACGLTALALVVLRTPNASTHHSFLRTALITSLAVLGYALCDTCFQHWAKPWGVLRFAAITFTVPALVAFLLIPLFGTSWKRLPRPVRIHALIGSIFCAGPALCMGLALGRYGHAPEVNVVYSTRALFSIAIVWFFGRHIGNIEHTAGRAVLLRRLTGALILFAAVALILFGNGV